MCMGYGLKWERIGVVKKFTEKVNDTEFMAATEDVQNNPNFGSILFVINDFSEVNDFEVTPPIIKAYFASVADAYRVNDKVKIAFITQDRELEAQINTFVHSSPLPYRSRVFKSVSEARNWCKGPKFKSP